MDRDELQRISRLIELNRMRLSQIEDQVSRLEEVRQEHAAAVHSLERLDNSGAENIIMPIGAGIQLKINSSEIDCVIVDLGSGVLAQRSAAEAQELLAKRDSELMELIKHLTQQHSETHNLLSDLITQLDIPSSETSTDAAPQHDQNKVDENQTESEKGTEDEPMRKRRRRGFGTELTLDD